MTSAPMYTRRPTLACLRLAYLAGSLRQGLPGDGRPRTETEARGRCPHRVMLHRLAPGARKGSLKLISWTVPADGEHTCFGGWVL